MKLTEIEREFIAEMAAEPGSDNEWANFDPPFLRKSYDRFIRKGWLEYQGDGQARQFRWTEAGRKALEDQP